ncbi:hypothetical protein H0H93_010991, partial [Arthromyces matolae]
TAPPSLPKQSSLDIWIDSMDTTVRNLERFANGKSQSLKPAPTNTLHSQEPSFWSSLTPENRILTDKSRTPVSSLLVFDRVYGINDSPHALHCFVHNDLEDQEKNGIDDSMNPAKSFHQSISTVQKSLGSLFQKRILDSAIVSMTLK